MKATTKQVLIGSAWLTVLLAMIGGIMLWQHQVHKAKPVAAVTVTSTERIPMVLLLDSRLTRNQNQQLIENIQHSSASQTLVTAKITTTGTVTFKGQFLNSDNRPYLQVQLPANISYAQQARLLKRLLTVAQRHFQFQHFNLVSYGKAGITAANYVESSIAKPTLQHLVLIATPFNGTDRRNNRSHQTTAVASTARTAMLSKLIAHRTAINHKLHVLIIAEKAVKTKQDLPLQSALAGQSIFKPVVKVYQQKVFQSWQTQSGVLGNRHIGNTIQTFIN